ncbi:MAG: hypothetical protein IPP96_17350 [Chitinophagaceae bacterium]|nr:hypothetical protein [Chitinophagaceae bacterium]
MTTKEILNLLPYSLLSYLPMDCMKITENGAKGSYTYRPMNIFTRAF